MKMHHFSSFLNISNKHESLLLLQVSNAKKLMALMNIILSTGRYLKRRRADKAVVCHPPPPLESIYVYQIQIREAS